MRRILTIALVLAGAAIAVLFAIQYDERPDGVDKAGKQFEVELDNAFGLIKGGDLKIAGVRAGELGEIKLDRKTNRAVAEITINENGFGSLRSDVKCEVRPQSLIGEYFVDCLPGTSTAELPEGSRIPVEQTSSTVPPDLVNNVLRRPYRERLSLIIGELGAGVAGNGKNLNAAVKRAAPALRETDVVLAKLAKQNQVLADLVRDADTVVTDLASSKKEISRWVDSAGGAAVASAERREAIAAGLRRLPAFLDELEPTMRSLGVAVDNQTPALNNLRASAGQLEQLFDRLQPFADASKPAFAALGDASTVGREAVKAARPTIAQLGKFSAGTPELGKNLAIILEHLNDREHSVEEDARSPEGKGYTGLEALLAYVYDQALSTNVYDSNVHYLKVSPFTGNCAPYADIQRAKQHEEECGSRLGPNPIGINFPDPTKKPGDGDARRRVQNKTDRAPVQPDDRPEVFREPMPGEAKKPDKATPPVLDIPEILPGVDIPPIRLPDLGLDDPDGPLGRIGQGNRRDEIDPATQARLLDYLLGDG